MTVYWFSVLSKYWRHSRQPWSTVTFKRLAMRLKIFSVINWLHVLRKRRRFLFSNETKHSVSKKVKSCSGYLNRICIYSNSAGRDVKGSAILCVHAELCGGYTTSKNQNAWLGFTIILKNCLQCSDQKKSPFLLYTSICQLLQCFHLLCSQQLLFPTSYHSLTRYIDVPSC